MADILVFPHDTMPRRRPGEAGNAEIVIFPGIRVEYHDRSPEPAGTTPSRRRSRRRLAKVGAS